MYLSPKLVSSSFCTIPSYVKMLYLELSKDNAIRRGFFFRWESLLQLACFACAWVNQIKSRCYRLSTYQFYIVGYDHCLILILSSWFESDWYFSSCLLPYSLRLAQCIRQSNCERAVLIFVNSIGSTFLPKWTNTYVNIRHQELTTIQFRAAFLLTGPQNESSDWTMGTMINSISLS